MVVVRWTISGSLYSSHGDVKSWPHERQAELSLLCKGSISPAISSQTSLPVVSMRPREPKNNPVLCALNKWFLGTSVLMKLFLGIHWCPSSVACHVFFSSRSSNWGDEDHMFMCSTPSGALCLCICSLCSPSQWHGTNPIVVPARSHLL